MRTYKFAKITARNFPTIADLNNPWIFQADVAVVVSVTPHYDKRIVEAMQVKGWSSTTFHLKRRLMTSAGKM